ncbi:ATP-binding cassette domain-containing protein [Lacticaseibacillus yichunensis]|uniref:ATP-binding cassette domain-containing protein n=1 Tax=Lacticaseibacillus yichunensis TaxID=2486015 RepID=A0ABW4CP58_9LACO|nr:ATP-binding cassette domain-containing protein [Lacticaseibacillus yichunensis]
MTEVILEHVSKHFHKQVILNDISYTFEGGRIYGLRGKNGVGKTMILRAIAGLIKTQGKIEINGVQLGEKFDFPPDMGLLIENNELLPDYTAKQNLEILAKIKRVADDKMISNALVRVGLDPNDKRKVRHFSLGMRQRLAIAQAIFERPQLIFLDEPTNALDTDGVTEIKALLEEERDRGALIIIASHITEDLNELADTILMIQGGQIIEEISL